MDFKPFDERGYPTVSPREGYDEWAPTYDQCVLDEMDVGLLERVTSIDWRSVERAIDLACGTGRIGAWLRARGVNEIDGVDLSEAMLARAKNRGVYTRLVCADVCASGFAGSAYDLTIQSLADEHMKTLAPLYAEASRLVHPNGRFVLVGYHPFFLMRGMPTHFHRDSGEAMAIESHVHLFSDHVAAAAQSGWRLEEMHEAVIDDAWLAKKGAKWERYRSWPISFVMVYRCSDR